MDRAPYGTRGGVSMIHNFPADGKVLVPNLLLPRDHRWPGRRDGAGRTDRYLGRWGTRGPPRRGPLHVVIRSQPEDPVHGPVPLKAGPHQVSAAFVPPFFQENVVDLISPLGWSLASTASDNTYGFSTLPHMRDFVILGPHRSDRDFGHASPGAHLRLRADRGCPGDPLRGADRISARDPCLPAAARGQSPQGI